MWAIKDEVTEVDTSCFTMDSNRELMGNMIYVDDEIKQGLGYHQMILYAPIKLISAIKQNGA